MPKHWRGAENEDTVRAEFESLSVYWHDCVLLFLLPMVYEQPQEKFRKGISETSEHLKNAVSVENYAYPRRAETTSQWWLHESRPSGLTHTSDTSRSFGHPLRQAFSCQGCVILNFGEPLELNICKLLLSLA